MQPDRMIRDGGRHGGKAKFKRAHRCNGVAGSPQIAGLVGNCESLAPFPLRVQELNEVGLVGGKAVPRGPELPHAVLVLAFPLVSRTRIAMTVSIPQRHAAPGAWIETS